MRRPLVRLRGLGTLAAVIASGIACGGLAVPGESAHAAGQATVTCPTVSASGAVTPAPAPGVDWAGCTLYQANLSGANLTDADLAGASLILANLTNASLSGAGLSGANLGHTNLTNADLAGADLTNVGLNSVRLQGADLANADLAGAVVQHSNLDVASLSGSDLTGTTLYYVGFTGADLSGADLTGATLTEVKSGGVTGSPSTQLPSDWTLLGGYLMGPTVDLAGADLAGLDLAGVDLQGATLVGATVTNTALAKVTSITGAWSGGLTGTPASLPPDTIIAGGYLIGPGVMLWAASLDGLNLAGSDLAGADLVLAHLSGADLSGADVTNADFQQTTLTSADLDKTDFSTANIAGVSSGGITGVPAALPKNWELVKGYLVGPEANLLQASLAGLNLNDADLAAADFYGADLTGATLSGADLDGAQLIGAKLKGANLSGVNLAQALMQGADLTGANLAKAILTGADLTGVTWMHTVCPDSTNSDKHLHGCLTPLDTTPPAVTVTGVSKGKVYVTGAVPVPGCKTTDDGTVATKATLTLATTGTNGAGRYTATCSRAVDLAGNKQKTPVIVTYTVVYGLHGFIAPAAGSTVARSSKKITVRLRLTNSKGAAVPAAVARTLAAHHDVRVTLTGPGIKAVTVNCGWNTSQQDLACLIGIPTAVRTGSAQKYTLTATEDVGTGFLAAPAVGGTADPEVIHFR